MEERPPPTDPPTLRSVALALLAPPRLVLLVLAGLAARHVVAGTKPWETNWAERVADGRIPGQRDFLEAGLWCGSLAAFVILVGLLVLSRWWWRPELPEPERIELRRADWGGDGHGGEVAPRPRRFWLVLAAVLAAAAVLPSMRMDHSFWGDEEWTLRKHVHGVYVPVDADDPLGPLEFEPVGWDRTFFYDRAANNHYLFSVLQRLSVDSWRSLTGAPREAISEAVTRIVPFAAGLATLAAMAVGLRGLGFPGAGLLAAVLFALHPMQVRYTSEARGYSMLALFTVLATWATLRAAGRGRWRDWALFAAVEFAAIYTWRAAVVPVAVFNVVLLVFLATRRTGRGERFGAVFAGVSGQQVARWFVTGSLAAAAYLVLAAPGIPQVAHAMDTLGSLTGNRMDRVWLEDSLARLTTGVHATTSQDPNPVRATLAERPTWLVAAVLSLLVAGAAGGFARVWRTASSWAAVALAVPLLSLLVAYVVFQFRMGVEFRYWYQFYAYPAFFMLAALGLAGAGSWLARRSPAAGTLPVAAALGGFAVLVAPALAAVVKFPFEDFRRAAAMTRGAGKRGFDFERSETRTVNYWRVAPIYDPRAEADEPSAEDLARRVAEARAAGHDLFVTAGNFGFLREATPEVYRALEDPDGDFEVLDVLHSEDPMFSLHLYRMRDGTPGE